MDIISKTTASGNFKRMLKRELKV